MMRYLVAMLLLAGFGNVLLAQKEFGFDNRKASGQSYLKPEETVARMKVPPEFEVKLFAGEPLLANPIAFSIDERGRIWAIECFEYPSRTPTGKMPRDRIVILEDTDGDGTADKRTVFAEGKDFPARFDLASGLELGHGGVYVGAPPYLWFIENKDDKPGKFEILAKGFGSEDTHETLNTFQWGPDGWLYGLHGVFTQSNVKSQDGPEMRMNAAVWRFHPKTKKFEVYAEGTSNPWGMDWRNGDGQFILACCVIPHLFHIVPGGIYKRQAGASYNPYSYGQINEISDHTFHKESGWAHAGLLSLDAPHIPEKYRNSVIFGSIHGCSLKQNILKPNGSSYIGSRADDFLVSGDKNFRPINLKWGPNGDIYLIDWHDQNPCHQAAASSWDYERGRVYRIAVKGAERAKPRNLGALGTKELVELALTTTDPYLSRTSMKLLAPLPKAPIKSAMMELNLDSTHPDAIMRLSRLVATQGDYEAMVNKPPPESLKPEYRNVNVQMARMMLNSATITDSQVKELSGYSEMFDHAVSRREMALLALKAAPQVNVTPLLHKLWEYTDDVKDPLLPQLTWLAYEKILSQKKGASNRVAEEEIKYLVEKAPQNIFVRDHIVPRVMRRLVATGQPADLALCIQFLREATDLNTREKALDGLSIALQGLQVPPPEGWAALRTELYAIKNNRITNHLERIGVAFKDPLSFRRLMDVAKTVKRSEAERVDAVRQLSLLKNPEAIKFCLALVREDKSDAVRAEAVRTLGVFPDRDIPQVLVLNWKEFPAPVRTEVV
ncbi:MAG: PVC-type heme-binding CxxCH protein, partial [Gemmataceae bacterium]